MTSLRTWWRRRRAHARTTGAPTLPAPVTGRPPAAAPRRGRSSRHLDERDEAADRLPPVTPRRGTPPSPASSEVTADGVYDRAELERFVLARVPGDPATIVDVLDLYDEHLAVKGIATPPASYRFYDPDDPRIAADAAVDESVVIADAEHLLGVDGATVSRVLEAEFAYLDAKGLLG